MDIVPAPGCTLLEPGDGAFAQVLAFAVDRREYEQRVLNAMKDHKATVLSIEASEPVQTRLLHGTVSDELMQIVRDLKPEHVRFDHLYIYPQQPE